MLPAARGCLLALVLVAPPLGADAPPLQAAHARPLTDVVYERTAERVERGRYLANAAIGCVLCHSERDEAAPGAPAVAGREFAGAILDEREGRRMVAPNLTPDVETGAGGWSDDALARAIREGVGHDGRGLSGPMWWWAFRRLSDEDVAAIVVYLRSLPPVRNPLPKRILSEEAERRAVESGVPLTAPVAARDLADPVERGRYLIDIADCLGCHTGWEAPTNPGFYAGGNVITRRDAARFSANLTPDPSGLGGWTPEIFRGALRNGRAGALHPMMPWAAYRNLTDDDLAAIYAALRLATPVRHFVSNAHEPKACAVCGQEHGLGELNVAPVVARVERDLGALERYAGRYRMDDIVYADVSVRDGALHVAFEGGPPTELIPIAGDRFAGIGLPSPVAFEIDAAGDVVAFVTYELGPVRWPRSK